MKSNPSELSYKPQLDTLRAFAVIGVMTHHYLNMYPWLDFGGTGVSLFFALSGFLITGILLNAKYAALNAGSSCFNVLRNFVMRRMLRIFPIYYIYILFFFLIGDIYIQQAFHWYATYTQNIYFVSSGYTGRFFHMWSLAIEEQFYIFWPWFILFIPRKWEAPFILSIILSSLAFKIYLDIFELRTYLVLLPAQLDALGTGAFVAYLTANRNQPENKYERIWRIIDNHLNMLLTVLLWLCLIIFYLRPARSMAYFGLLYSVFAALFVYKASKGFTGWARRLFENSILIYIGKISYGIYLYHTIIPKTIYLLETRLALVALPNPFVKWAVCVVITILVASVSWYLIEKPVNGLKKHFHYIRSNRENA